MVRTWTHVREPPRTNVESDEQTARAVGKDSPPTWFRQLFPRAAPSLEPRDCSLMSLQDRTDSWALLAWIDARALITPRYGPASQLASIDDRVEVSRSAALTEICTNLLIKSRSAWWTSADQEMLFEGTDSLHEICSAYMAQGSIIIRRSKQVRRILPGCEAYFSETLERNYQLDGVFMKTLKIIRWKIAREDNF